jgi:hypothetical protein
MATPPKRKLSQPDSRLRAHGADALPALQIYGNTVAETGKKDSAAMAHCHTERLWRE